MEENPSIVEYFYREDDDEGHSCGYCGSSTGSISKGMWAHQMTCQDYQDLIDRGWRRSGKYCYKPTMKKTCCPQYPIRCDTSNFKLNKSHKKIIKKVNRFLITGVKSGSNETDSGSDSHERTGMETGGSCSAETDLALIARPSDIEMPQDIESQKSKEPTDAETAKDSNSSSLATMEKCDDEIKTVQQQSTASCLSKTPSTLTSSTPKPGSGADPSKPKCRKAKDIRAEKRQMKKSTEISADKKKKCGNEQKSLEDFLNEPNLAENPVHKLELRLVRSSPATPDFNSSFKMSHSVYHSYQMAVHKDPPEKPNPKQYTRFLCDSPLMPRYVEGGLPHGYGSFHQHYLLDGKIIAVGVLDILPASVSSVYLYYDPDYSFLGLGVYSALREIAFIRSLTRLAPDLKYYYMGFYLHNCPKMRYKGQYVPSYISCPESYRWVAIDKCRPKLDVSKYTRLEEDGVEDADGEIDLPEVLCLHKRSMMPYGVYKMVRRAESDEDEVKEYAGFVGRTCAQRMLLFRK